LLLGEINSPAKMEGRGGRRGSEGRKRGGKGGRGLSRVNGSGGRSHPVEPLGKRSLSALRAPRGSSGKKRTHGTGLTNKVGFSNGGPSSAQHSAVITRHNSSPHISPNDIAGGGGGGDRGTENVNPNSLHDAPVFSAGGKHPQPPSMESFLNPVDVQKKGQQGNIFQGKSRRPNPNTRLPSAGGAASTKRRSIMMGSRSAGNKNIGEVNNGIVSEMRSSA